MFTKSVEASRKVAVSTPPSVIGTSANDWGGADGSQGVSKRVCYART